MGRTTSCCRRVPRRSLGTPSWSRCPTAASGSGGPGPQRAPAHRAGAVPAGLAAPQRSLTPASTLWHSKAQFFLSHFWTRIFFFGKNYLETQKLFSCLARFALVSLGRLWSHCAVRAKETAFRCRVDFVKINLLQHMPSRTRLNWTSEKHT